MKKFIRLSVMALVVCLFAACQSEKEAAYSKLKGLYEDVTLNSDQYTTQDWENFLIEFQKVDSLISVNEYTDEELKEIGRLKGKCASYAVKAGAEVAGKKLKDVINEAAGIIDGFMEGFGVKEEK